MRDANPHRRSSCRVWILGALLLLSGHLELAAQTSGSSPFSEPDFVEAPPATRGPRPPRLSFDVVGEIPLRGPLGRTGAVLREDRIEIRLDDAMARTGWTPSDVPELLPLIPAQNSPEENVNLVESANGRYRYRLVPDGLLIAEKQCKRCRDGWRKRWKLRVPGTIVALPVISGDYLYFGAMDNMLYCVRRRNGHRMWERDLEGRLQRSPTLLNHRLEPAKSRPEPDAEPDQIELLLITTGNGGELVALSAQTGDRVARYRLSEGEGRLVGMPVVTPDGTVAVAHQKYRDTEAGLLILALRRSGSAGVAYNGPSRPGPASADPLGDPVTEPPLPGESTAQSAGGGP